MKHVLEIEAVAVNYLNFIHIPVALDLILQIHAVKKDSLGLCEVGLYELLNPLSV